MTVLVPKSAGRGRPHRPEVGHGRPYGRDPRPGTDQKWDMVALSGV